MVGISVALAVEHLPTASVPSATSLPVNNNNSKPKLILLPNLDFRSTVKSNIKQFVEDCLFIPAHLQSLSAPLFTKLGENESVEDLYAKYDCHAEAEHPDLHVDEDTYTFWGRESGKTVDLQDAGKLEDYHILDKSRIFLKTLPESLPKEGGRIFVETKDGILPLLGIGPFTRVSELKRKLEAMTGILASQQLLSSVGRVMHDEFLVKDFDGFHAIYKDSVIDLCKSGDSNLDQAHRRMIVYVNVIEERCFTLVVQPSDLVGRIMQMVESSTGILQWQQRITFSGKILQEKKALAEYFIYPECTMNVNVLNSPAKSITRSSSKAHLHDHSEFPEEFVPKPAARKFKLVRTRSGHVKGTLTIPVLTTDRISDLKRKIKRSLQPSVERSSPVCSSPDRGQAQSNTPKTYPVTGANKFPVPVYPLVRTTSAIETLVKQMANSVCLKSPSKQSQPSTPTSYFTPPEVTDSPNFLTPPTKLGPSAPASCKISDSAKPLSLVRRLQFGDASCSVQTQSPTFLKQSYSPLRQIFPPLSVEHNAQNQSAQDHTQRGSRQHVSIEAEPENYPNQHVVSEKKSLGAWLTQNMHTLKGHIRVTFAEK